ncbi:MAG: hypothetical protein GX557_12565, partial [Chloroflexi bacterium]|nr:hypothetical protein [Chloroflexota bacterium]
VIDLMPEQRDVRDKGGTMRLGHYPCVLKPGTKAYEAYALEAFPAAGVLAPGLPEDRINERHRHRYEVNNQYREALEAAGLVLSGLSPSGYLVEVAELRDHPWMVGSQFHPELQSRPNNPHPLFRDFVAASLSNARLILPFA